MLTTRRSDQLYLIGVREQAATEGHARVTFLTTRGDLEADARAVHGAKQAVVLLGGSAHEHCFDSDLDLLPRDLAEHGIGSLRIDYRSPGDCAQCAIDALLACQYLDDEGVSDVLLVGWSFGASVAIAAGSVARIVRGVAAVSPIDVPDCCVRRMCRKPLLVITGEGNDLASADCVRRVLLDSESHARLLTYPGQRHGLWGVRERVRADLLDWIALSFDASQASRASAAMGRATA